MGCGVVGVFSSAVYLDFMRDRNGYHTTIQHVQRNKHPLILSKPLSCISLEPCRLRVIPQSSILAVILDQSDPASCASVGSLLLLSNRTHSELWSSGSLREGDSSPSASRALNPGPKTGGETTAAQPGLLPALGAAA